MHNNNTELQKCVNKNQWTFEIRQKIIIKINDNSLLKEGYTVSHKTNLIGDVHKIHQAKYNLCKCKQEGISVNIYISMDNRQSLISNNKFKLQLKFQKNYYEQT